MKSPLTLAEREAQFDNFVTRLVMAAGWVIVLGGVGAVLAAAVWLARWIIRVL
jgi:hypothetical protein